MHSMILRRMTGRQAGDAAEMPLTSSRAVRLALTKAANDTIGLVLTVIGMGEETQPLDDLLGGLDDNLMLIGLQRDGKLVGLTALDMQLRAAMLEMQTTGRLIAAKAEERPATRTDKSMCDPVLSAFLSAFPTVTVGTEFDGWADGVGLGDRIDSSRAAGLMLADQDYRILRLSIDLGVAERQGQMLIALPLSKPQPMAETAPSENADWATLFQAAVADAPGELDALLHRLKMPLSEAQNLQVGQVLPLLGCTVNSVRLLSQDGQKVAQAKLGQLGGMRAVRVEPAPLPQLHDLSGAARSAMPALATGGETASDQLIGDIGDFTQPAGLDEQPDDLMASEDDDAGDLPMAPMDLDAISLSD